MGNRQSIITVLTDFGGQDYFVAAMKGVILSINPKAHLVDITHQIPPQDIHAAAFNLLGCYKSFPAATIHVAVVDPGVGSTRRPVLIESAGQFFVGPDNGIFSWVCEREGNCRATHLTNEAFFNHPVSATFHGRDVFAPVAAALSTGIPPQKFGSPINDLVTLESLTPRTTVPGCTEGRIIHIDRFGNCITNLAREDLSGQAVGRDVRLRINDREIDSFKNFFAEEATGRPDVFALWGSAGFLELAGQNRSAADLLQARRGQSIFVYTEGSAERKRNSC